MVQLVPSEFWKKIYRSPARIELHHWYFKGEEQFIKPFALNVLVNRNTINIFQYFNTSYINNYNYYVRPNGMTYIFD